MVKFLGFFWESYKFKNKSIQAGAHIYVPCSDETKIDKSDQKCVPHKKRDQESNLEEKKSLCVIFFFFFGWGVQNIFGTTILMSQQNREPRSIVGHNLLSKKKIAEEKISISSTWEGGVG